MIRVFISPQKEDQLITRKYSFSTGDKDSDIIHSPLNQSDKKMPFRRIDQSWDRLKDAKFSTPEPHRTLISVQLFPKPVETPAVPSEPHRITIQQLPEEKKSAHIE